MKEINLLDEGTAREKSKEGRERMLRKELKGAIEALLFSSSEPISIRQIREITENICCLKPKALEALVKELQLEYKQQARAFQIEEIADGFLIRTDPKYSVYVDQLHSHRRSEKLSRAATEVLAIIAFRQPVTRSVIDGIRGVDSSGALYALIERDLIETVGRLDAPGRPSLYAVTNRFLQHYGLRDLNELFEQGLRESSEQLEIEAITEELIQKS